MITVKIAQVLYITDPSKFSYIFVCSLNYAVEIYIKAALNLRRV